MYSQNDEERVILDYFKGRKGSFLDVGAFDGKTFSNTYALALLGWKGACVEASPQNFVRLSDLYADREDIIVVSAAVMPHATGLVKFMDTPDAVGSIDDAHVKKWEKAVTYSVIYVAAISAQQLVDFFPSVDFLSVDVEGISFDVALRIVPAMRPRLVCVELDGNLDDYRKYVEGVLGYKEIHRTSENIIHKLM